MARNNRPKPAKLGGAEKPKFHISPATQAVVLAKKIEGKSNRQIAREAGIHRETVAKILSQEEFRAAILEGRSRLIALIPASIQVYEDVLNGRRSKDKVAVARHVLDGTQVMIPRSERIHHTSFEEEAEKRTTAELEFAAKQGRWPTDEEMIHYAETGRWPQDETKN